MKIGTLHRLSLLGTPVIALLTVAGGSTLLLAACGLMALVLAVSSGQLLEATRSRPRTWGTHGVTLAVLLASGAIFRVARIDAVLIVVMLGVFNRFLLRQGPRDDFIIVGASSVLLAAGTTITPGVSFGLLLCLYLPVLMWALWMSTLLAAAEGGASGPRPLTLAAIARRPVPPMRMRIAAASLGLMMIGYGVVSLFPRYHFGGLISAGYFMTLPGAGTSMGMNAGGVSGGGGGAVVLRLEPYPGEGAKVGLDGLYARLYVLDRFDGRTWEETPRSPTYALYTGRDVFRGSADTWTRDDDSQTVRIMQERMVPRDRAHPVVALGRGWPAYAKLHHPMQSAAGGWQARFRRTAAKLVYKADLSRRSPVAAPPAFIAREQPARLTALPEGLDPRIEALARRLTADKATDAEKISAVLRHFDRGFVYSLEPLEGEAEDPIVRFLFEARAGHCELYAGAVAVLLRAAGVQARVATGYYGGWWNSSGGYLEMSDADAHAWVEAYDADRGWRWVDATPESERARRTGKRLAWLVDLVDAIEAAWFDNIVDFDERKRRALLGGLADGIDALGGSFEAGAGPRAGPGAGRGARIGAGLIVGVAVVLLIGLGVGGLWWSRREPEPEVLGARLRRALAPHAAPHLPLGALLAEAPPALSAPGRAAVEAYEAFRFDAPERRPSAKQVLAALVDLERARRAHLG